MILLALLLLWLLAINAYAISRMNEDRIRKLAGHRRYPESALLALALAGGTAGIALGIRLLDHKRGAPGFARKLWAILGVQAVVAALFGWAAYTSA